ncbi:MAG: beta-propeller domain-containing protein, partial [Pyrobaculum sp.]
MGVVHKCKEINFIISAPGLKPANKTTESLDTVAKTVELDSLATDGRLLAFVLYGKIYVIDVERRSLLSTISINAVGVFLWGDRLAAISYTPSNTTVYIYNNLTAPALAATKSYPSRPSGAWLSDGVIYLVTAADEEVHIAAVDLTTGIDKEISIPTVLSPYIAHNPQAYMGRRGLYVASMRSGYEEAWAKGLEAIARYVPDAEAIYMAIRRKDLLWPITGLEPERARAVIEAAQEELHDKTFRDSTTIHVVDKSLRYMGHVEVSGLVRSIEEVGNLLVVATTEDNAISQIHYDETKGAIYVWPAPAGRHVNIYLVSIPDLKVVRSLTLAEGEVARAARTAAGGIYLSTENM